ncbi:hypothetical protein ACKI2N_013160 [Cupriavidus sp. 30B13]|uniref:hypothetical protein n=1 Tax=Cupriavidus sp. 30B13 TaxID=3384241 RepID=UPI003B8FE4FF
MPVSVRPPPASGARRFHAAAWLARPAALLVLAATGFLGAPAAQAQTLAQAGGSPESVVARLMAWRMETDRPVSLAALTRFEWDDFGVVVEPAGDAMANCGQNGFMPCDASLQPARGTPVQVLVFRRAATPIYRERITVRSATFAEPLPSAVPRAQATLIGCPGYDGEMLWCLRGSARGRQPDRFLDGG